MKYLIVAACVALAACQPAPPELRPTEQVTPAGFATLLNRERAAQGLGALQEDIRLSRAARDHATDMVANTYFSHVGRNGSSFVERAADAGYRCAAAENIAAGQGSEAEVMSGWMASSGHRRNILLADAIDFGIGRAGDTWVLMLGRGC